MLFLVIGRVGYEFKKEPVLYRFDNKNWDNTEFGSKLWEMCEAAREYGNDQVEVHQVVNLGKRKGE